MESINKMKPILKIKNLTKNFGGVISVNNFSMNLRQQAITALLGPNGAGKTTIFNLISGLLEPNKGEIYFKNRKINKMSADKISNLGIGRLFQDVHTFNNLSALDNVILGFKNKNMEHPISSFIFPQKYKKIEKKIIKRAEELLNFVGLYEKRNIFAENLSIGQQKLLSIARLLAFDCSLMLLDEPTAGVAKGIEKDILDLLNKIAKDEGKTILIIEHKMNVILTISDWAIFMVDGQKMTEGLPNHVLGDEEVRKAYIGI